MNVIAPDQINLLELPSLPLSCKGDLPEIRAIYFSISEKGDVLYIGQTINLKIRWQNHLKFKNFVVPDSTKVAWLEINQEDNLSEIENTLIRHFNPPFNVVGVTRRIQIDNATEVQGRIAQLGIKIDAELYDKYKAKLREDGISITDAIENHMRNCVGEMLIKSNVIDVAALLEDVGKLKSNMLIVEDLKQAVEGIMSRLTTENRQLKSQLEAISSQVEKMVEIIKISPCFDKE